MTSSIANSAYQHIFSENPPQNRLPRRLPPTANLNRYQVTKTRNIVKKIFLSLAALSIAVALLTASVTPLIPGFFLSLGAAYLANMRDHILDPDLRLRKRNAFRNSDDITGLNKLNFLVARFIITEEEKQNILRNTIKALPYSTFMEIYGPEIFSELNEVNIALLKVKKQAFLLSEIDSLTYATFITKYGHEIFPELDDAAIELLKNKFLDYLSEYEIIDDAFILESPANRYFNLTKSDLAHLIVKSENNESPVDNEKKDHSIFAYLGSKAKPVIRSASKYVLDAVIPSTLKATGEYALASGKLAYYGKTKQSIVFAAAAATNLATYTAKHVFKILYPEASQIVNQQITYKYY